VTSTEFAVKNTVFTLSLTRSAYFLAGFISPGPPGPEGGDGGTPATAGMVIFSQSVPVAGVPYTVPIHAGSPKFYP